MGPLLWVLLGSMEPAGCSAGVPSFTCLRSRTAQRGASPCRHGAGAGVCRSPGVPLGRCGRRRGQPAHGRPGLSWCPGTEAGRAGRKACGTLSVKDGHRKGTGVGGPCLGPVAGVLSSRDPLAFKAARLLRLGPASRK